MTSKFDAYYTWLGIPPADQPPHYYRLLGIELLESNLDVISNAADQRMAHIRTFQTGRRAALSQQILNELSAARVCLLNAGKKAAYDEKMKAKLATSSSPKEGIPAVEPFPETIRVETPPASLSRARRAHRPRSARPRWLLPTAVCVGSLVVMLLAVGVFLLRGGESPETVQGPSGPVPETEESIDAVKEDEDKDGGAPARRSSPAAAPGASTPAQTGPVPSVPLPDGSADDDTPQQAALPTEPPSVEQKPATIKPSVPTVADVEPAPPTGRQKLPIPSQDTLQQADQLLQETFEKELSTAKSLHAHAALAREFLELAEKSTDDAAARYLLLLRGCELAGQAGEVALVTQAVDALKENYQVNALLIRFAALMDAAKAVRDEKNQRALAGEVISLIDEAVAEDRFDIAQKLVGVARNSARKIRDKDLLRQAASQADRVKTVAKQYATARNAAEVLRGKTDDADANLTMGKYYCLIKDNWARGLPMLAKGADPAMAAAAKQELDTPADGESRLRLANAWWKVSQNTDNRHRRALMARASHWYKKALPDLRGLSKLAAENRLSQLDKIAQQGSEKRSAKTPGVAANGKQKTHKKRQRIQPFRTEMLGGGGGRAYQDIAPPGTYLAGFHVMHDPYGEGRVISAIQPLYRHVSGRIMPGGVYGKGNGRTATPTAKNGYAVGGIIVKAGAFVDGMKIIFMRITPDGLDPDDTYQSNWIGGRGGHAERTLGGSGDQIVGIYGFVSRYANSIGLVMLKPVEN